jgi:hypothetical protein
MPAPSVTISAHRKIVARYELPREPTRLADPPATTEFPTPTAPEPKLATAEAITPSPRTAPVVPAPPHASGAAPPDDVSATPAISTSMLEQEAKLLRQANEAMRADDPDRALDLLNEHAMRFPSGALEPERSAERVFALCRAGRTLEAQGAAETFLRAHPSGPLAARVQASCAARERR